MFVYMTCLALAAHSVLAHTRIFGRTLQFNALLFPLCCLFEPSGTYSSDHGIRKKLHEYALRPPYLFYEHSLLAVCKSGPASHTPLPVCGSRLTPCDTWYGLSRSLGSALPSFARRSLHHVDSLLLRCVLYQVVSRLLQ